MKSLRNLVEMEMIRIPDIEMDNFQSSLRNNIYLEFFLDKCRALITPEYELIATGEASDEERVELETIVNDHRDALEKLKYYLIYILSYYSCLLESNSYYLNSNDNLLIARFVAVEEDKHSYVVKLYTIEKSGLPDRYGDKLYLGRALVSFKSIESRHYGLRYMKNSLIQQFILMRERLANNMSADDYQFLDTDYLIDMEESIEEFADLAGKIMEEYPYQINSQTVESETLVEVNMHFRELKHILIELSDGMEEVRERLFERNLAPAARYITKLKKDVDNNINYILYKINGRISDAINHIHG